MSAPCAGATVTTAGGGVGEPAAQRAGKGALEAAPLACVSGEGGGGAGGQQGGAGAGLAHRHQGEEEGLQAGLEEQVQGAAVAGVDKKVA